ncbi:MAG: hypothetical protein M3430_09620 [Acidobacteriota bacterium]|nr:hypothetical protein [Acidobacteriota bacterium]
MDDTMTLDMTATEAAQVQALAERCLMAIRESNERAMQTDSEMTTLQAETRALLDQLRMKLDVEATR